MYHALWGDGRNSVWNKYIQVDAEWAVTQKASQAKAHSSKIWFASFHNYSREQYCLRQKANPTTKSTTSGMAHEIASTAKTLCNAYTFTCSKNHNMPTKTCVFRHRMLSETTTALQRAAEAIAKLSIHAAVRLPSLQHRPTMPCCSIQRATRQAPLLTQTGDDSSISSSRHLACCASSDVTK